MEISFIRGNQVFNPGDYSSQLLEENIANIVLCEATNSETGNEVSILADYYVINRKRYDIKDFSIKAILTEDKRLIPLLRKANGLERKATLKVIPGTQHVPKEEVGEKTNCWPIINGSGKKELETTELVNTACNYALTLSRKQEEATEIEEEKDQETETEEEQ
jgi:hypothetical protein